MMLAMAFKADAAQHDHLVLAFDLVKKGLLKDRCGVVSVRTIWASLTMRRSTDRETSPV